MIAVVYSGSRFADWKLTDKTGIISEFKTPGINPFFNDEKYILNLLHKKSELINYAEKIKQIYFFGAGASSAERKQIIINSFSEFFRFGKVFVENDLFAAALASCKDQKGVVGVLGSGSNAGYFDGKKIKANNFGLGYILADEGSANYLGKKVLKLFLNDKLPEDLYLKFTKKYDLDRKQILDKVYRQKQPALFLSSFSDFLIENKESEFVKDLVCKGFTIYIQTYILPLKKQFPDVPIHLVGTIASNFEDWLRQTASQEGISIASVIKEPIYNVLNFYFNKI